MTFTSRLVLAFAVVLVVEAALLVVVSRRVVSDAFRANSTAASALALRRADDALLEVASELARDVTAALEPSADVTRLEGAIHDPVDASHAVYTAADRLRPETLDRLWILNERGLILSASPERERMGTTARRLAGRAAAAGRTFWTDTLPDGEAEIPHLFVARRAEGLVAIGARRLNGEVEDRVSTAAGAPVLLGDAGTWWSEGDASDGDRPPAAEPAGSTVRTSSVAAIRIAVLRSEGTLAALLRTVTRTGLVVGALSLALSALLASWLVRRLARPITELSGAAARVGRGDWTEPLRVAGAAPEFKRVETAFNAMQEELGRQRDALLRAERSAAWRDAARRVAHEIKNALTPIGLAAPKEAGLDREITSLKRLVSEFSEFAEWPAPTPEPVDLGALAETILRLYERAGVTLEARAEPGVVAYVDPDQVTRAVGNLVQNALDAAAAGGRVTVTVSRAGDRARIAVHDDGPGIPEADRHRIFDPYVTTKAHGTGLGLAIVQRIADAHGAEVTLTSEPGAGTTIALTFSTEAS